MWAMGLRAQGPKIFVKISLFWDVGFCIQNCCQTLWEYFPPIPDPISPISDQNLPDFGEGGTADNSLYFFPIFPLKGPVLVLSYF